MKGVSWSDVEVSRDGRDLQVERTAWREGPVAEKACGKFNEAKKEGRCGWRWVWAHVRAWQASLSR